MPALPTPPSPRGAASYVDRHRFGRVGRIPSPTGFPVGDINSYLLLPPAGSRDLTLVDTGIKSPAAFDALRQGFKEYGFALEDVRRILITHAHPDHYGQAKRLVELSGATVYASEIEAERMKTFWLPSAQRDERTIALFRGWGVPDETLTEGGEERRQFARSIQDPIDVDVVLAEGDRLELGDFTFEVIETPGHCEGHIVFYERDTKMLLSGDHLLTDISPVPLLSIPKGDGEPRPKSLVRFMESLEKVERLDCAIVFPSHGDVILDHRKLVASYRLHHERRALQIERTLAEGPRTPFELARRLFPKHWQSQIFLVMSEVIGHLDVLERDGRVVMERRDGVEVARCG
jgi:glyoxylase-like metal-dependent hydrolase (beta-lactamase superfamily II)